MNELLLEKVLRAVEQIPSGCVATYKDIADLVGIGPRHVGNVLGRYGSTVTWWRVVNGQGRLPDHLLGQARERWTAEGIALRDDQTGCVLKRCRADRGELARRYDRAVRHLGSPAP